MNINMLSHKLAYHLSLALLLSLACSCKNSDPAKKSWQAGSEEFSVRIPEAQVFTDSVQGAASIQCDDCDYIVGLKQQVIDGKKLAIKPGELICLSGKIGTYDRLTFINLNGTPESPIQIKNCDGLATIDSDQAFGMKIRKSEHIEVLGNGDARYLYGIKISTKKGFYLTFEDFTTEFKVAQLEIAGKNAGKPDGNSGFAGIGIKTSPYQNCELFQNTRDASWTMKNVIVEHCYIHDTGGEGLYIGHGFYNGRIEKQCTDTTYSHSIHNLSISNNIIQNVGYDGIQIKNADKSCQVSNNYINGFGLRNENGHNEGLFIGEGTTGTFTNNIIMNGSGHGIQLQGMGDIIIANNIVINVDDHGFYAASGPHAYRLTDGFFHVYNNSFIDFKKCGFAFFNNDGGVKRLHNNVFASTTKSLQRKGAQLDSSHNIFTNKVAAFRTLDEGTGKYSLIQNERMIGKGLATSEFSDRRGEDEKEHLDYQGNIGANIKELR